MIPECWPKTRRSGVHAATILPYVIFFFFLGGGAGFGNASYWAKRDMAEMVSADPKRQVINGRVQSTSLQQFMYVPNYWGWCQVSANIEVNSQ